jgi:hypothetical protein
LNPNIFIARQYGLPCRFIVGLFMIVYSAAADLLAQGETGNVAANRLEFLTGLYITYGTS